MKEVYLVNNLPCDLWINTNDIKSNNIYIK